MVELRWDREVDGAVVESFVILQGDEEVGTVDTPVASFTVTGLTPKALLLKVSEAAYQRHGARLST